MSMRALPTAAALLALLLAGCVVGPDYKTPSPPVPETWGTPLDGGEAAGDPDIAEWWRVFGDPTLDTLVARALHNLSPRRKKPFVAVNCGALPETLLESELFGYKAGAFTDARKDKPGRFRLAKGGSGRACPCARR